MKKYKLKIKILSPLATPLQADTIWGHICWGIKYNKGEKELENFINLYDNSPPLILSEPFPDGYFPRPILKPYVFNYKDLNLEKYNKIKKLKKIKYLKEGVFINKDKLSEKLFFELSEEELKKYTGDLKTKNIFKDEVITRNIIDRKKNQTKEENGVFSTNIKWINENNNIFNIIILSNLDQKTIIKYFKWGFEYGYGADVSIGKGKIDVIEDSIKEIKLDKENCNKAMALANFIPTIKDRNRLKNFRYEIFTKFGKLGNEFVFTKNNPFKKPIIFYKTGATFDIIEDMEYIGKLIKNVHDSDEIVQYAYAPLIFFNEMEE